MDTIFFLTLEHIITIHSNQIDGYGGSHGIRDISLLESAVFRPQTTFGGEEMYESIFDKAAALVQSIIMNHAFLDGNKRTGMVSGIIFLEINRYSLVVSQKELVKTAIRIAKKEMGIVEIAGWLKKNSKRP